MTKGEGKKYFGFEPTTFGDLVLALDHLSRYICEITTVANPARKLLTSKTQFSSKPLDTANADDYPWTLLISAISACSVPLLLVAEFKFFVETLEKMVTRGTLSTSS